MKQSAPAAMPQAQNVSLQAVILQTPALYVRQKKKWLEILTNWEAKNKYDLVDAQGQTVGQIVEQGNGLLRILLRLTLRTHRPFAVDVVDMQNQTVLCFSRRVFFLFSDIAIQTPSGMPIGSAHRRFAFFSKRYDLRTPDGVTFARIKSGFWRLWTFPLFVADATGADKQAGQITKKWGGALKELFTNTDSFQIDFGGHNWKAHERAVILATAMAIDFDFFERKGSGG